MFIWTLSVNAIDTSDEERATRSTASLSQLPMGPQTTSRTTEAPPGECRLQVLDGRF